MPSHDPLIKPVKGLIPDIRGTGSPSHQKPTFRGSPSANPLKIKIFQETLTNAKITKAFVSLRIGGVALSDNEW